MGMLGPLGLILCILLDLYELSYHEGCWCTAFLYCMSTPGSGVRMMLASQTN